MDATDAEEHSSLQIDAKLHTNMCRKLSTIVSKVMNVFPVLEAARPRSKSGIQALCALHVALDKAKNLLQHCSDCSKLYLAITCDSVLLKFERASYALQETLRPIEDIVHEDTACQIMEIVNELEQTVFSLDESDKQIGEEVIALLQKDRGCNGSPNENGELEVFHQAASRLGITSSKAALTERRALKKLIEKARSEEDRRKESIVSYLLHLLKRYSKVFRSDMADDTDSQGSAPCSPKILGSLEDISSPRRFGHAFERHLSRPSSFSLKQNSSRSGNVPIPPEEFRCPISLQLMYDPVIISSGQTYERACIEKWFNDGHSTCPKTQQQLTHLYLTPNYCVKGLIASWCEQNGMPIPDGPPESLDNNYWRLSLSDCETLNSRSISSLSSCKVQDVKILPLEGNHNTGEIEENEVCSLGSSFQEYEGDFESYESLLALLYEDKSTRKQKRAVEHVRLLLKDDEEARIYMGANGFVEALIQYLRTAISEGDRKAEEVAAMALFNLAVNNNRNKGALLSAGVIPLLEQMIENHETCESATALYLNLSCLEEAKPIIGSSPVIPFLVQFLQPDTPDDSSSKHDALYALFNLSTHPSNVPYLLSSGIVDGLYSLITCPCWAEKALAVFINLASTREGKSEIVSRPGLMGALTSLLDTGEPSEQEQAVTCLLILCSGDENCSQLVLQEGVIPALVSVSVNGSPRGREKAHKLLKLFREQRQRETLRGQQEQQQQQEAEVEGGDDCVAAESKQLYKWKSKKISRTLSSMWKNRGFPVYHC